MLNVRFSVFLRLCKWIYTCSHFFAIISFLVDSWIVIHFCSLSNNLVYLFNGQNDMVPFCKHCSVVHMRSKKKKIEICQRWLLTSTVTISNNRPKDLPEKEESCIYCETLIFVSSPERFVTTYLVWLVPFELIHYVLVSWKTPNDLFGTYFLKNWYYNMCLPYMLFLY